ncbi:MAG: SNF2-related protein [Saprospiraceae bacterium]
MIVFNLVQLIQQTWTVEVWITEKESEGLPSYLKWKLTPENFTSFFDPNINGQLRTLVDKCDTLSHKSLEVYLNRNNKKRTSLLVLFEDPKQKKWVSDYIDKRLADILHMIRELQFPLLVEQKKIDHIDNKNYISFCDTIIPDVNIKKTALGMHYTLLLRNTDGQVFKPYSEETKILTNLMPKIIINKNLYSLEYINGNKLRPFLNNASVYIKDELSSQFFNTFLADLTSKVQIEAEGFDVSYYNQLDKVLLTLYEDIGEKKWMLSVEFYYGDYCFIHGSKSKMQSKISLNANKWIVTQIQRSHDLEKKYIDELKTLGLVENYNSKFYYGDASLEIFEFFNENKHKFSDAIIVQLPKINNKQIVSAPISIHTDFTLKDDWFDLGGTIRIGDISFPITKLFNSIKHQNRYFELPDNTMVILPEYLFSKYEGVVRHAISGEIYRMAKHHKPLITFEQNIPISDPSSSPSFVPHTSLKANLRPYQIEGVQWLVQHRDGGLGALLADDMGLGKTLQTLTLLLDTKSKIAKSNFEGSKQLDLFQNPVFHDRKPLRALIVLPSSLIHNWRSEIYKYTPTLQSVIFIGDKREKLKSTLLQFDIVLTTYQTLYREIEWLKNETFNYIILDESQYIKNKESQIFKAISQIKANHKLSLSGTPIENSLDDLWSQMQFINPNILGDYHFFKNHYKTPIEKDNNIQILETLKKIVQPYILRRTKQQVAPDLPELIQQHHFCEMPSDHQKKYMEETSKIRNHLLGLTKNQQYRFHVFSAMMALRQIANHPILKDESYEGSSGKLEELIQVSIPILQNRNKILFFSSFEKHLTLVAAAIEKLGFSVLTVSGETSQSKRTDIIDKFQKSTHFNVLGMTLKTGGVGLNITRADYIFILDPWWNPFSEMQAVSRAHRIGRASSVIVYRFISKDTIEEKIVQLQNQKQILAGNFLEHPDVPPFSIEEMESLLQ